MEGAELCTPVGAGRNTCLPLLPGHFISIVLFMLCQVRPSPPQQPRLFSEVVASASLLPSLKSSLQRPLLPATDLPLVKATAALRELGF